MRPQLEGVDSSEGGVKWDGEAAHLQFDIDPERWMSE
jgi:hypothetical protein